jgi:tRNA threonylcarbamoyladenosine biosynthesis protein TsaE
MSAPGPEMFTSLSPEQTLAVGRQIAQRLDRGDCVELVGPLGAGKTCLTRGLATGLGLADPRLVSSPTFVLVHEYVGRLPIYHLDLYRLDAPDAELIDLGLDEMLDDGVVLIEWADRAGEALPRPRWRVELAITGESDREVTVRQVS